MDDKQITLLAGGVGGAKLVYGFANNESFPPSNVIVNTGDDFSYYGLKISPDIDSVLYALANISHPTHGFGRYDDTYTVFDTLSEIGERPWFRLGDKDLALNLIRTQRINSGEPLSEVTLEISKLLDVTYPIYPMTDGRIQTKIETSQYGTLDFQEYFVKYQFKPAIKQVFYSNIENATLCGTARIALEKSKQVVICPSNPWLSIFPILSIQGVKEILQSKRVLAVSPIIGQNAVKGPTAKIFREFGITPSALEVAKLYEGFINQMVIDKENADEKNAIEDLGIETIVTDIIMADKENKIRLAKEILCFMEK
jgi:LPPG:FO 2-phospho-L-lactate transferase